jgi:hypothetical protein
VGLIDAPPVLVVGSRELAAGWSRRTGRPVTRASTDVLRLAGALPADGRCHVVLFAGFHAWADARAVDRFIRGAVQGGATYEYVV